MKKKFKINWKYLLNITITLAIIFSLAGYGWWYAKQDKSVMMDMRIDAHRLITAAESKHRAYQSRGEEQTCYMIEISEDQRFYHENAHNYIGSVSFEGEVPVIFLSDGEFLLEGSNHNFEVIRSDVEASQNC